jgi:hypothetical protein
MIEGETFRSRFLENSSIAVSNVREDIVLTLFS